MTKRMTEKNGARGLGVAGLLWGTLGLGGLIWLPGCAEVPFSVHAQDNDLKTLRPALSRLQQAPKAPAERAMVYAFAGPDKTARRGKDAAEDTSVEKTLYGYDLSSGRQVFAVPADVRSRFAVSGGVLVHREGERSLVLRDAQTGAVRTTIELDKGETFAGLTADETQIYYVTRAQEGGQRTSFVTALTQSGQRVWRLPAKGSVGAPAVQAGVLALPYRYQEFVLIDTKTGAELTRIRQKDEQIGFARPGGSAAGFFYGVGDKGAALLTESSVKGTKGEIAYLSPKLGERVRTFLHWDGYRAEQTDFSAFDRNRLLWEGEVVPGEAGASKIRFKDDQAVLHSYRFCFGMDTQTGEVKWAYASPRENLMASDLTAGAVLFATQGGELGALDRQSGAKVVSQRLQLKPGQTLIGASFDAAGYRPPAVADAKAPPVLDVLRGIIFDRDSSFISVKAFAVQALAARPGREATAELLKVVTAEGMPPQISRAAGDLLVARRDREASGLIVEALAQRYDYLEDKRPRGIDTLARAAAAMDAKEAVPQLAQRLLEPSTPQSALKDVVTALVQVGGKDAVRPLRELLLLYRSDALFATDAEPLKAAGEGLLKVGGEPERRMVSFVSLEPRTLPAVASHFQKLLTPEPKKATESPKAKVKLSLNAN